MASAPLTRDRSVQAAQTRQDLEISRPGRGNAEQNSSAVEAWLIPKPASGYFIEPTIVADRPQDDERSGEIFGPSLPYQKADDASMPCTWPICTRYGSGCKGVFTSDFSKAHQLDPRYRRPGQVYINDVFLRRHHLPFGGTTKQSALRRRKGLEGLKSYAQASKALPPGLGLNGPPPERAAKIDPLHE